mgnify:CR=1 FL=1
MRAEKKYELMLLRLRYLKKDLQFVKETNEEAQQAFSQAFKAFVKYLPDAQRESVEKIVKKETPPKETEEKKKTKKKTRAPVKTEKKKREVQKLFKKVAKDSHPDRIIGLSEEEQERKKELFKEAQAAADESDLFDLIEVAEKLDIEIPEASEESIELLKESIAKINGEIKKIKQSFAWVWYHDPSKRDKIMRQYIGKLRLSNPRT